MTTLSVPHRHFAQCSSTNDLARDWALDLKEPAPCGALVTSDFQTQGRGRRGREWQAGFGQSALMSFVYRPNTPPAEFGQLSLVAALAVVEALETVTGLGPQIKWPNDILLAGGKVAGILAECCFSPTPSKHGPMGPVVILGIGINVNQERFVGAESFVYPPTSLRLATGREQETNHVIESVAESVLAWEVRWRGAGFSPILEECRKRLAVGAALRRGELGAELVGLNPDGSARVRLPDGTFGHWATVE